jgi:chemotaxis protein MotB
MKLSRNGIVAGMLGVVCVMGLTLGGCANSKKKTDLAMQEAADLRQRHDVLDQANRDKDSKIAELESALATCRTQPVATNVSPVYTNVPAAPMSTPVQPADTWSPNQGTSFVSDGQGNMVATIAGNVLFDSGKATLKDSARKELDKVAREMRARYKNASVRVEGHTDTDPIRQSKWKNNDELSQARADAVMRYLSSKGVDTNRISSMGFGSSKPKGTKAASRRVEIVVTQ